MAALFQSLLQLADGLLELFQFFTISVGGEIGLENSSNKTELIATCFIADIFIALFSLFGPCSLVLAGCDNQ